MLSIEPCDHPPYRSASLKLLPQHTTMYPLSPISQSWDTSVLYRHVLHSWGMHRASLDEPHSRSTKQWIWQRSYLSHKPCSLSWSTHIGEGCRSEVSPSTSANHVEVGYNRQVHTTPIANQEAPLQRNKEAHVPLP